MIYEDIASPRFFSKDKSPKKIKAKDEYEEKYEKKSKHRDEEKIKPSATITVPLSSTTLPSIPSN